MQFARHLRRLSPAIHPLITGASSVLSGVGLCRGLQDRTSHMPASQTRRARSWATSSSCVLVATSGVARASPCRMSIQRLPLEERRARVDSAGDDPRGMHVPVLRDRGEGGERDARAARRARAAREGAERPGARREPAHRRGARGGRRSLE